MPFQQIQAHFEVAISKFPVIAGNEAVNFALDNFRKQGFLGYTFQPWKPRKAFTKWGKQRQGRALLVKSGKLRRSIRITASQPTSVTVGTDVPYAKTHNEGLNIGQIQSVKSFTRSNGQKVSAHTRRVNQKIPARPFLQQSQYLNNRIARLMVAEIMKTLR